MGGQHCGQEAGGWAGTAAVHQPAWRRDHGLDAEPRLRERVAELEAENQVLAAQLADETPARAAGGLRYVHIACTEFLTALHTGGRSAGDIDAGGVLPGHAGTIVRDGYADYDHLSDAVHAWCGAHGLRDLKGLMSSTPAARSGHGPWPTC